MKKIKRIFLMMLLFSVPLYSFGMEISKKYIDDQVAQGNVLSDSFSTEDECKISKDKYNKSYSNYTRSECFFYNSKYYYFICEGSEKCLISQGGITPKMSQTLLYQDKLDAFLLKIKKSKSNMGDTSYLDFLYNINQKMTSLKQKYNSNATITEMLNYLIQGITQLQKDAIDGGDDFLALICDGDKKCYKTATTSSSNAEISSGSQVLECNKEIVSSLQLTDWSIQTTAYYGQTATDVGLWLKGEPKNMHPGGASARNMWEQMALNAWAQELNNRNFSGINWKEVMKNSPYIADEKITNIIFEVYGPGFKKDQNSRLDPTYDWVGKMIQLLNNPIIIQDIDLKNSKKCETLQKNNPNLICDFKDWKTKINYGCAVPKNISSLTSSSNIVSTQCRYGSNMASVWTTFNRSGLPLKGGLEKSQKQQTHSYSFQLNKTDFPNGTKILSNNWSDGTFQYASREMVISECPHDFENVPSGNKFENCSSVGMFQGANLGYLDDPMTQDKNTCNLVPGKTYYLNIRNIYSKNESAYLSSGYLYDTVWIKDKISQTTNQPNSSINKNNFSQIYGNCNYTGEKEYYYFTNDGLRCVGAYFICNQGNMLWGIQFSPEPPLPSGGSKFYTTLSECNKNITTSQTTLKTTINNGQASSATSTTTIPSYCGAGLIAPNDKLCTGNGLNDPCLSADHWKNKLTVRDCESIVKKGGYSIDAYDVNTYCPVNAQNIFTTLYLGIKLNYTGGSSQEVQSKCATYIKDQQANIGSTCSVEGYQVSNASGELICTGGKYKFNCNRYYQMPSPRPPYESVCGTESQNRTSTTSNNTQTSSGIPTCNTPDDYYYYYNPDVKNAGVEARKHWDMYGKNEKRKSCW